MRIKIIIVVFLFFLLTSISFGKQVRDSSERKEYPINGLTYSIGGFNYFTCGLGYSKGEYSRFGSHFFASSYGVMAEYKTLKELYVRPFMRMYGGSAGLLLGVSSPFAKDFDSATTVGLAPEIGFGFSRLNILYRYNFYLDSDFNCHEILLVVVPVRF